MNWLNRVRIVLVETSHPGNIGAVARAMKNMSLTRLLLVRPRCFPHAEASARASGADDILANAKLCENLPEAIGSSTLVCGMSARERSIAWPQLDPRECAGRVRQHALTHDVALVFGREKSGLSNTELDRCHFLVRIPCNPQFPSLNLGAAVQIVSYELQCLVDVAAPSGAIADEDRATAEEVEGFYDHLETVLHDTGFLDPGNPRHLMRRIRRIYQRSNLSPREVKILRGILTSCQKFRNSRGR